MNLQHCCCDYIACTCKQALGPTCARIRAALSSNQRCQSWHSSWGMHLRAYQLTLPSLASCCDVFMSSLLYSTNMAQSLKWQFSSVMLMLSCRLSAYQQQQLCSSIGQAAEESGDVLGEVCDLWLLELC